MALGSLQSKPWQVKEQVCQMGSGLKKTTKKIEVSAKEVSWLILTALL